MRDLDKCALDLDASDHPRVALQQGEEPRIAFDAEDRDVRLRPDRRRGVADVRPDVHDRPAEVRCDRAELTVVARVVVLVEGQLVRER